MTTERHYLVTYEVNIWAPDPLTAADQVFETLLDPMSLPPAFEVLDVEDNRSVLIDLWTDER